VLLGAEKARTRLSPEQNAPISLNSQFKNASTESLHYLDLLNFGSRLGFYSPVKPLQIG